MEDFYGDGSNFIGGGSSGGNFVNGNGGNLIGGNGGN